MEFDARVYNRRVRENNYRAQTTRKKPGPERAAGILSGTKAEPMKGASKWSGS